jgi:peptide deformylase
MALREIVTVPEPVLRRKAHRVTDFGAELQTLITDMVDTMRQAPGVGLAAPQVAVPLRVIVVEYSEVEDDDSDSEPSPPKLYAVVNPEISRMQPETKVGVEGCLSIPGFVGEVERPLGITIKGQNRRGQPLRIKAEGWLARIFLHDIDHLDGVLFTDRASRVWRPAPDEEPPLD